MDLIDRQALLKQIDIDSDGEPGYYGDTWKFIDTIKSLPSATDTNVGTKLGTDLAQLGTDCISRQQAIEVVQKRRMMLSKEKVLLINDLEKLPPAQPEIIRCKDCKHWVPYDWMFSEVWQSKNIADYPEDDIGCDCSEMAMKANDFCSRGERR